MAERHAAFLKDAWAKEPVLVESFTIGGLAVILPIFSPFTKYATMNNQATPYNYPVPLRDDGTCPTCPATPGPPGPQSGVA
ncbi:NADH dehydrogenase [ubiquinone] 1 alpha subcomplex subunit 3-like isoform X2 [Canis lupus familiaris]|uniref:NADH dehydrogenase [ubiquinone] 1 alpha subcomplex subunit 3-like isoform X2 n=1 Tax=Canis lupus familiaris TaxID=9615 RepID=UPI0018F33E9C|nr:NADH dehydrogenase [ubiquinone] 1 alpha subcomplex subunit 3-like isoform X2 [Canis lupus familiaris]